MPSRCHSCGGGCQAARLRWPGLCPACAEGVVEAAPELSTVRLGTPLSSLRGLVAAASYEEPLAGWLWSFKYQGRSQWSSPFGRWMAAAAVREGMPAGMLVGVPADPLRALTRSHQPAALLAEAAARGLGWPLLREGWVRRAAPAQATLAGARRRTQLTGLIGWHGRPLGGRRLVVVDDVCTTGGTLAACARALTEAGAGEVWGLVLCRQRLDEAAGRSTSDDGRIAG